MLNITRHQRICNMVQNKGNVTVSELQAVLGVSEMTIRRDLNTLSQEGLIMRVHGGAALRPVSLETPFYERVVVNSHLKRAITRYAVTRIEAGDILFIDGSTTCSELADMLPENMDITVITNSLEAVQKLRKKARIYILSLGGDLAKDGNTFDGMMTLDNAEKIVVKKCFISGSGFSERGVLNAGMVGTAIKKVMLRNAREKFLLADSTKHEGPGLIKICEWNDIDVFICDNLLPADLQKIYSSVCLDAHFVKVN